MKLHKSNTKWLKLNQINTNSNQIEQIELKLNRLNKTKIIEKSHKTESN